jgi:hypothetical protein
MKSGGQLLRNLQSEDSASADRLHRAYGNRHEAGCLSVFDEI